MIAPKALPNGPTVRGADREAWLRELLDDAQHSARMSAWETDFIADMVQRFQEWGGDLRLTVKQREALERIERKVYGT